MHRRTNSPESQVSPRNSRRYKTAFSTFHIEGPKIQDAKVQHLIINSNQRKHSIVLKLR